MTRIDRLDDDDDQGELRVWESRVKEVLFDFYSACL